MKKMPLTILALAMASAFSAHATSSFDDPRVDELRTISDKMRGGLKDKLVTEMQEKGAAAAIDVCAEAAPKAAKKMVEDNKLAGLKRVTFKNRNPKSTPDEWEAESLKFFESLPEADRAKGENFSIKDGEVRYMRALVVAPLCLSCHGDPDKIAADVKLKLSEKYPNDAATGYKLGDIRGAISIRKKITE